MTTNLLPPHPMPSHPRRRDTKTPLPAPEDRTRLRRAWQLTDDQVAAAFGVTAATVRSWESGRTTPTGLRRAAYAAFLHGLAHGLTPSAADTGGARSAVHAPRRATRRRPEQPVDRPQPRPEIRPCPAPVSATPGAVPRRPPAATPLPVGTGPDPVAPARRRRLHATATAAAAWTALLHLLITSPPPHM
ncbi:helix-turn-helix domain-containing protein [Streptomyces sp. NBC_00343]|uniref:helix-turn-helix domain-containing protein n=1 Tax=Streptomyces sp. NBC_00343 TaxID=2975719 RepID=UPI002E2A450A|nr:hypothetical protein [Streptomyces sp. NBC_00343]